MVSGAVFDPHRPLLVHLVVTRRCNLACSYCTEYDHVSAPVPVAVLRERIDHLARLRTVVVTLTGGETLLHPDVAALVAYVRARGMTPALNTNGFLLTADRIRSLNDAGLYALQISLDGVTPNAVTKKTLKPLLPKLRLLAEHAAFRVRVNTVLGVAPPEEAVEVARVALAHGFDAKCSLVRHADGSLATVDDGVRAAYQQIKQLEGRALGISGKGFRTRSCAMDTSTGSVARARASSTSARTGWSTCAGRATASPPRRSPTTAARTSGARSIRRSPARRPARSPMPTR